VPFDQIFDMWRPLNAELEDPVGADGTSNTAVTAGRGHGVCRLHLLLHKSRDPKAGLLAPFGRPQDILPVRIDVGDLILVSSKDVLTHAIKLSTWSQWDHVAMIVETSDQLRLFEATRDGVAVYKLSGALKLYHVDSKIGVRRLQCQRTPAMLSALAEFVAEVRGRPYKQDYMQLVRAAYGNNKKDDISSFFCSQLIAAAYQRMGLLGEEKPSNDFLPSDFASVSKGSLLWGTLSDPVLFEPSQFGEVIAKTSDRAVDVALKITAVIIFSTSTCLSASHKKKYTTYNMQVKTNVGGHWTVSRRFNDFYALDKQLRRHYRGLCKTPPKTYVVNKFDPSVVRQRTIALQTYINQLVESACCSEPIFISWLTNSSKGVGYTPKRKATTATPPRPVNVSKYSSATSLSRAGPSPLRTAPTVSRNETIDQLYERYQKESTYLPAMASSSTQTSHARDFIGSMRQTYAASTPQFGSSFTRGEDHTSSASRLETVAGRGLRKTPASTAGEDFTLSTEVVPDAPTSNHQTALGDRPRLTGLAGMATASMLVIDEDATTLSGERSQGDEDLDELESNPTLDAATQPTDTPSTVVSRAQSDDESTADGTNSGSETESESERFAKHSGSSSGDDDSEQEEPDEQQSVNEHCRDARSGASAHPDPRGADLPRKEQLIRDAFTDRSSRASVRIWRELLDVEVGLAFSLC